LINRIYDFYYFESMLILILSKNVTFEIIAMKKCKKYHIYIEFYYKLFYSVVAYIKIN